MPMATNCCIEQQKPVADWCDACAAAWQKAWAFHMLRKENAKK